MALLPELLKNLKAVDPECPYVDYHLKNIITKEGENVTFYTKVTGLYPIDVTWYKNGLPVNGTTRLQTGQIHKWHILLFQNVNRTDSGIYTAVCRNNLGYALSQAILRVNYDRVPNYVIRGALRNAIFISWPQSEIKITQHLRNVRIEVGDPIMLRIAISKTETAKPQFAWFKNGRDFNLNHGGTEITSNENVFSEYVKYNASVEDSGIYTALVIHSDIIMSSSAEVVVMKSHLQHYEPMSNSQSPCFIQPLPEELDVYESEEVIMVCQANLDQSTEIHIFHDGVKMLESSNIKLYGPLDRGLGIKIEHATLQDKGLYTILLQNKFNKNVSYTECALNVKSTPPEPIPKVELISPLKVAISTLGNRLCLFCQFKLPTSGTFFANWRIGFYQVTYSTPEFEVFSTKAGVYMVYIKKFDLEMAGEVSCHLKCLLSDQITVQVATTKGLLVDLPLEVFHEENFGISSITTDKIYTVIGYKTSVAILKTADRRSAIEKGAPDDGGIDKNELKRQDEAAAFPPDQTNYDKKVKKNLIPKYAVSSTISEVLMEILYCRLPNEEGNFLMMRNYFDTPFYVVSKTTPIILNGFVLTEENSEDAVEILWEDKRPSKTKQWYAVDKIMSSGEFQPIGVTSSASMTLVAPKESEITNFQIRIVDAVEQTAEASIAIAPPVEEFTEDAIPPVRPLEEFDGKYKKVSSPLGLGSYGAVYSVKTKEAEQIYAAKFMRAQLVRRRNSIKREIGLMQMFHHNRIVKLYEAFYSQSEFILVMEYLWGGELFERIVEDNNLTESAAVHYIRQICEGLEYLHQQHIVHLDIKPENILCVSRDSRDIKIVDFGCSRAVKNCRVHSMYGTKDYIAPEIFNFNPISPASDMWSLGVLTYVMLSGTVPFRSDDSCKLYSLICAGRYDFLDAAFDNVSEEAIKFIEALLVVDPKKRMTAVTAREHPWMTVEKMKHIAFGETDRWRKNMKIYLDNHRIRWQETPPQPETKPEPEPRPEPKPRPPAVVVRGRWKFRSRATKNSEDHHGSQHN